MDLDVAPRSVHPNSRNRLDRAFLEGRRRGRTHMEGIVEAVQPMYGIQTGQLAVDVKQAAQMLGICTKTLRREIDRGELAALRIGKAVRIRVAEIHAYLKRKERKISCQARLLRFWKRPRTMTSFMGTGFRPQLCSRPCFLPVTVRAPFSRQRLAISIKGASCCRLGTARSEMAWRPCRRPSCPNSGSILHYAASRYLTARSWFPMKGKLFTG